MNETEFELDITPTRVHICVLITMPILDLDNRYINCVVEQEEWCAGYS